MLQNQTKDKRPTHKYNNTGTPESPPPSGDPTLPEPYQIFTRPKSPYQTPTRPLYLTPGRPCQNHTTSCQTPTISLPDPYQTLLDS